MTTKVVPAMSGEEMVALSKKHTLYEWSAQSKVDPLPVAKAKGIYFWTSEGKRFIDFSRLTNVSLPIGHAFTVAPATADKSAADAPVKCALFCDKPIGFAIARLYETLTTTSSIEARAFRDRAAAAKWLAVPAHILNLGHESAPHRWKTVRSIHERHFTI